jgi:exopolyphosphatase/guanosine-5'-triphosphate,3'-diphosphate pyrophosphatase
MLRPGRIQAGVAAVASLWKGVLAAGPIQSSRIVATSAVRSAANAHLFVDAVEGITRCRPEVLSGIEEAEGIALGLRTDPAIGDRLPSFTAFDLGGGSLELIRFEDGSVTSRISLKLGSVRLTEKFVKDPELPLPLSEREAITRHIVDTISESGFPLIGPLVGCSGGLAALRHSLAAREQIPFEESHPVFSLDEIDNLTELVLAQDLENRIKQSFLPLGRADIFPAALLTFQQILNLSGCRQVRHSLHNLRYGLAWSLLQYSPEDEGPAD